MQLNKWLGMALLVYKLVAAQEWRCLCGAMCVRRALCAPKFGPGATVGRVFGGATRTVAELYVGGPHMWARGATHSTVV